MVRKAAVVYCSPGGSTRHVAQVVRDRLEAAGTDVVGLDLGKKDPGGSSAGGPAGGTPVDEDMGLAPCLPCV